MPFAGFLVLATAGKKLSRTGAAVIGAGSAGVSALISLIVAFSFISSPPAGNSYSQVLWEWVNTGGLSLSISFYLDALSVIMVLVVSVVGFLIHLYSTGFMARDDGYSRFFSYMNLFVGSMLTLVLAGNLLLLFLGWEGVGLCSYLLIGFWYRETQNGYAALKAFIVTRIGDTAMAIGLFLLFYNLGTLDIQQAMGLAKANWPVGSGIAIAAAALLLGGALGKSAQLPLQTWLPDAMAGPTPVSALIHAATMVTAGVYLIARTHVLFTLAPPVQSAVAIIGAATLLVAGFSALAQHDIKRVLAYSTISQIGYMFLALGVGAWSAAIFHFMTHAFFKALLFLGAGVVIQGLNEEHDMFRMGGLRKEMPATFWSFLIGAASLSALPLVTAGFYSKDLVLWDVWSSRTGGNWLWAAGLLGALLTSIYSFRMVFLTFYGEKKTPVTRTPGPVMLIPVIALAALSAVGGFVEIPGTMGNVPLFSGFLETALPKMVFSGVPESELISQIIAAILSVGGIYVAYFFWLALPEYARDFTKHPAGSALHRFLFSGWGFDWLYARLFVRPYVWAARVNKRDVIDLFYSGIALINRLSHYALSATQTGKVRWYVMVLGFGAFITITIVVFT